VQARNASTGAKRSPVSLYLTYVHRLLTLSAELGLGQQDCTPVQVLAMVLQETPHDSWIPKILERLSPLLLDHIMFANFGAFMYVWLKDHIFAVHINLIPMLQFQKHGHNAAICCSGIIANHRN
jgi:hypothetical protein